MGLVVGDAVGCNDGVSVGLFVGGGAGFDEGAVVGCFDGSRVGGKTGFAVGALVGIGVTFAVGVTVGGVDSSRIWMGALVVGTGVGGGEVHGSSKEKVHDWVVSQVLPQSVGMVVVSLVLNMPSCT